MENLETILTLQPGDEAMTKSINDITDLMNGECRDVVHTISTECGKASTHDAKARIAAVELVKKIIKCGDSNYLRPLHVKAICNALAVVSLKNDSSMLEFLRDDDAQEEKGGPDHGEGVVSLIVARKKLEGYRIDTMRKKLINIAVTVGNGVNIEIYRRKVHNDGRDLVQLSGDVLSGGENSHSSSSADNKNDEVLQEPGASVESGKNSSSSANQHDPPLAFVFGSDAIIRKTSSYFHNEIKEIQVSRSMAKSYPHPEVCQPTPGIRHERIGGKIYTHPYEKCLIESNEALFPPHFRDEWIQWVSDHLVTCDKGGLPSLRLKHHLSKPIEVPWIGVVYHGEKHNLSTLYSDIPADAKFISICSRVHILLDDCIKNILVFDDCDTNRVFNASMIVVNKDRGVKHNVTRGSPFIKISGGQGKHGLVGYTEVALIQSPACTKSEWMKDVIDESLLKEAKSKEAEADEIDPMEKSLNEGKDEGADDIGPVEECHGRPSKHEGEDSRAERNPGCRELLQRGSRWLDPATAPGAAAVAGSGHGRCRDEDESSQDREGPRDQAG